MTKRQHLNAKYSYKGTDMDGEFFLGGESPLEMESFEIKINGVSALCIHATTPQLFSSLFLQLVGRCLAYHYEGSHEAGNNVLSLEHKGTIDMVEMFIGGKAVITVCAGAGGELDSFIFQTLHENQ